MSQIRNRFDIAQSIIEEEKIGRKMPNFFDCFDEIKPAKGLTMSVGVHIILVILFLALGVIYDKFAPHLPKPKMPVQDVEFKLVQNNSQKPINPKTRTRSDRDSRAGGKHDPKRVVSQPSPAPSPKKTAQAPSKAQKKQSPQPKTAQPKTQPKVQNTKPLQQKTVTKPQPKTQTAQQTVQKPQTKPTPIKAPNALKPSSVPAYKPTTTPSAPKVATAPKSPFKVAVPPTKAPVGSTYRPQPGAGASTKGSSSTTSSGGNLSPKFSASKTGSGSSSGSSASKGSSGSYAYRGSSGSSGYGQTGNPSPGDPNGTPGIDAIRQPNWGPYMRDLEQRIKRNWTPPKGDTSKRIVITFTIGRDGRLLSHRITKSSGIPLADRAAMSAIELTAPFRPLPPEFKGQSVPIEFTFDYNVLNSVLK